MVASRRQRGQSWRHRAGVLRLALAAVLSSGLAVAAVPAPRPELHFTEVAAASGLEFVNRYGSAEKIYPTEFGGSGGAWVDYDVDGWPDLVLVNALAGPASDPAAGAGDPAAPGHGLFRNDAGEFDAVAATAGVDDAVWGNGAAVADVDHDGFPDLYVTAIGANRLYRNNGDGTLSRWDAGAEDQGWGTSAVFLDWDGDGHLDLYVVNYVDFDETVPPLGAGVCFYRGIEVFCGPEGLRGARDALYRNLGDGSFAPWPGFEADPAGTYGFAAVATDCDGDGQPDLYVATDSTVNLLYRHAAGGFEDWSLFGGAGYSGSGQEQAGMGATAADYDRDGDFDLFVTNFQNDYNTLYRNRGDCLYEDVSGPSGLSRSSLDYLGWATLFVDLDGDADEDLYVANGHIYPQLDARGIESYPQRNLVYLNRLSESGEPVFEEIGEVPGSGLGAVASSRGAAVADHDNDGDTDLLVTNIDGPPHLLRNDGEPVHPSLLLDLVGRSGNRSAYGARVTVVSGDVVQHRELRVSDGYAGSNDRRLRIHLPSGRAEELTIRWRGGEESRLTDVGPGWFVIDESRGVIARRPSRP